MDTNIETNIETNTDIPKKKLLIRKNKSIAPSIERVNLTPTSWIDLGTLPDGIAFTQPEFDELWDAHPPELGKIKLYGKIIETPRYQQTYLKNYKFTGMDHQVDLNLPLHPLVIRLFDWVNNNLSYGTFNQVLINWYQDGTHYIGPHSDSESQLVPNSPIFSVSLGATRTFRLRKRITGSTSSPIDRDFSLTNNSFAVMGGTLQKTHKHEITKITGDYAKKVGPRINITFRQFKE